VVEDNPELNRFLVETLREDYRVTTAFDGVEGLEKAATFAPDLILTDIMMPRMSGDALVAAVREEPALAQVPIIVLSAKADDALRLKLLNGGAQDYVVKPFSSEEVLARVKNLVSLRRARAELEQRNEELQRLKAQVEVQAQEDIRLREERFHSLVTTTAQVVWTTDASGLMVEDSPTWRAFTGQSHEEGRASGWLEAVHPDDRARVDLEWREAVRSRRVYETEYRLRRQEGGYTPTMARAAPVLNLDGTLREWVGMNFDIQDQKRAEAELRRAVQLRDEFLSVAAHELRTPLTSLKLQLELISRAAENEGGGLSAQLEPKLKAAHRQANRLNQLNGALLDVTRLQAGRLHLEREEVDFVEVVQETLQRLAPELERAGCTLSAELATEVRGQWDRLRLEQVLVNLLMNATRYGAGKPIEVRLACENGEAVLSVRDEGIGIAPEDQQRIFRRFERAVSVDKYGGLGLGLFISSEIISALGGSISVASQPGAGATFIVRLPLSDG
jgi:PAS domain S-box-containing protein